MITMIPILTSATDMWLYSSLPIQRNRTLKTSEKYSKKFQRQVQNIQRSLKKDEILKRKKCDQFEFYLRPGAQ